MTAISVTFTPKVSTDWDPQKPLTTTKMNGLVDNTTHLREWLGANYYAGAIQDHNHDGSNSASVPVGPNFLRNGSFESGLAGWTSTLFNGGTIALNNNAAYVYDGNQSLAITSTVLANGGGTLLSNEFVSCSGGQGYGLFGDVLASIAGVSGKIEVEWYDSTQALISSSVAYTSASIPTAYAKFGVFLAAPAAARYMRVLCTGGIPATGTAVGTVYFDGLILFALPILPSGTTGVTQGASNNSTLLSTTAYADAQATLAASTKVPNDVGYGGVGALCQMYNNTTAALFGGSTIAGGSLKFLKNQGASTTVASGTWRVLDDTISSAIIGSFQRIS